MRFLILIALINLLCVFNKGIGQDTSKMIKLKPIEVLEINYLTSTEQQELKEKQRLDSLYNTEGCIKIRHEYDSISKANREKVLKLAEEVEKRNDNPGDIYYYFMGYKCIEEFDFGDCGAYPFITGSGYHFCMEIELWIEERKKSDRVFSREVIDSWERSTGAVFYYEDIKRFPGK